MPISIADRLQAVKFRPSGFDDLRIVLAVSVVLFHSFVFSYGEYYAVLILHSWVGALAKSIVPMFFCLSGFLVAGSVERCRTLVSFLSLRVIRIYPALVVEIFLSALVIGPLATTLPLAQYFTDHTFFRYLLNATGNISYLLPGVFAKNPLPNLVNWQLWTVPSELICYVLLSILVLFGLKRRRYLAPMALVCILAWHIFQMIRLEKSFDAQWVENGAMVIAFFVAGVGAYLYRDRIPYDGRLTALAGVTSFVLLTFVPGGDIPAVFTLAYLTVGIGLTNVKRVAFIGFADFSYGIYLYSSVIGQFMIDKLPWGRHVYWNVLVTLPVTCLFALGSWYLVEKPALSLRRRVGDLEEALLGRWAGWFPGKPTARSGAGP